MFVPHVFVDRELAPGAAAPLAADDAHHLLRVLRRRPGDPVVAVTPAGRRWLGRLAPGSPPQLEAREELPSSEPPVAVTLGQGLPKGPKMEEVIRHGTEVGVARFVPVLAARSVSRPGEAGAAQRVQRWQRIAREAARQSQRSAVPQVEPPCSLDGLLSRGEAWDLILMPWEEEEARGLREELEAAAAAWGRPAAGRRVLILVGPEGGWDAGEVEAARRAGARVVTLGPRILRTETAGVLVAGLVLHVLGDLG
ncbi:RsmE family RNA methyltransferase [Thermaerobacter subterraneus]|uniref:Ribosomal RNA small subunit methyltransferase E n=1 Tax=Thermaerobacter subterraneus DSM 13965 TaxID=867903 RepID=K6QDY3_9FIRM|nr:16S rRNA (uracil(1498)-N(3))-methyltransferase [Thermaerobacter subterraneus]EKP94961.1 RNA methyltransferase, RsmE family [Thermaerobacter subterraneus DSM 13965]